MNRNTDYHRKVNSYYFNPIGLKKKISKREIASSQASRPSGLLIHQIRPETSEQSGSINKSSFSYQYAIGRGGFGKV